MHEATFKLKQACTHITKTLDETKYIVSFCFTSKKGLILATSDFKLVLINLSGQTVQNYGQTKAKVTSISCNAVGTHFLVTTESNDVLLYSVEAPSVIKTISHHCEVVKCALDPEFTPDRQLSFFFVDSASEIYRYNEKYTLFRKKSEMIAQEKKMVHNIAWCHGYIVYVTQSLIVVKSAPSNGSIEPFIDIRLSLKGSLTNSSVISLPNDKIGVSVNSFYYEINTKRRTYASYDFLSTIISISISGKDRFILSSHQNKLYLTHNTNKSVEIQRNTLPIYLTGIDNTTLLLSKTEIHLLHPMTLQEIVNQAPLLTNPQNMLETLLSLPVSDENIAEVVKNLISIGKYQIAVQYCVKTINPSDIHNWNTVVQLFNVSGHLNDLIGFIPFSSLPSIPTPTLSVLKAVMKIDPPTFYAIFSKIPDDVDLHELVQEAQSDDFSKMLIYHKLNDHTKALDLAISVHYQDIFTNITKYKAYRYCLEQFSNLCDSYGSSFVHYLLQIQHYCSPELVFNKFLSMKQHRELFYIYADNLRERGHHFQFKVGNELAVMMIEHRNPKVYEFLLLNMYDNYSMIRDAAMKMGMYKEAAYVAGRTGAGEDAMKIYLNYVRDPELSVSFAEKFNDRKKWDMVWEEAYKDESLLNYLLDKLENYVDRPDDFIRGIPDDIGAKVGLMEKGDQIVERFEARGYTVSLAASMVESGSIKYIKSKMKSSRKAVKVSNPS